MKPSDIYAWVSESLSRLFEKSPTYFVWWQVICAAIGFVAALPTFLAMFHIIVPLPWTAQVNHIISAAMFSMAFMSKLTVKVPTVAVNSVDVTGTPTCTTVVNPKLPFTAKEADVVAPAIPAVKLPYSAPKDGGIN